MGDDWILNPGDVVSYGPKIDVIVDEATGRDFQCATIEVDFQLSEGFNLPIARKRQQQVSTKDQSCKRATRSSSAWPGLS